ncbi:unnamed protein product [Schistosoma turkestanicum]|nr:unnamed protein product [Schistosoma turkestanicum]
MFMDKTKVNEENSVSIKIGFHFLDTYANIENENGDGAYEDPNDAAAHEAPNGDAEYAEQYEGAGHEEVNQNVGHEVENKQNAECLRLENLYFTKWAKHYLSESIELFKKKLQEKESEIEAQINHDFISFTSDNRELEKKLTDERDKLSVALEKLTTLMKESEYLRILLIKVSPKNERVRMALEAMQKCSKQCSCSVRQANRAMLKEPDKSG